VVAEPRTWPWSASLGSPSRLLTPRGALVPAPHIKSSLGARSDKHRAMSASYAASTSVFLVAARGICVYEVNGERVPRRYEEL
jgi:hypothetical protein